MKDKFLNKVNAAENHLQSTIRRRKKNKYYAEVSDSSLITDLMIRLYTNGSKQEYKVKSLLDEYYNDSTSYFNVQIKENEDGSEYVTKSIYNKPVWVTLQNQEVTPFDYSCSESLTLEEQIDFPQGTLKCKAPSGYIYYHAKSKKMWRPCKSRLHKFGLISMNLNSKNPENLDNPDTRNFDQFIALDKILTIRNSKQKRLFEDDCFIKSIGEYTYDSRTNTHKITPLRIYNEEKGIRYYDCYDYINRSTYTQKAYELTDMTIVLDIDCGLQSKYIMKCLNQMPFSPNVIIEEKGMGLTKEGNSTALISLDRPITPSERATILRAYRLSLCFDYDVYAIDCHCTGIGYGKNPLKTFKNELQRRFYVCVDNKSYLNINCADSIIAWSDNIISKYGDKISTFEDEFISSCAELKNSKSTFSKILEDIRITEQEEINNVQRYNSYAQPFKTYVDIGERNDYFCRVESSIFAMQYYLMHGLTCIYDNSTASTIANIIYPDILQRYNNSDNQITLNWLKQRLNWTLNRDKECLSIPLKRIEFLQKLLHQRNICLHNNECRLHKLHNMESSLITSFIIIPEFEEISYKSEFNSTQQKHGANVQLIKGVLYAMAQLGDDITSLKSYFIDNWPSLQNMCEEDLSEVLPPNITDKNRRYLITRILMSWSITNYYLKNYRGCIPKVNSQPEVMKFDQCLDFWQFSLKCNGEFIFNRDDKDEQSYIIATYIKSICEYLFDFAMNESQCSFKDISKVTVRKMCSQLYRTCGINISILHHIMSVMSKSVISPYLIHSQISAVHSQEIANLILTSNLKHRGYDDLCVASMIGNYYRNFDIQPHSNSRASVYSILSTYTSGLTTSKKSLWYAWKQALQTHITRMLKQCIFDENAGLAIEIARTIMRDIEHYFNNVVQKRSTNEADSMYKKDLDVMFDKNNIDSYIAGYLRSTPTLYYFTAYESILKLKPVA